MHAPLRYQLTAHDCGPASVLNALAVLFEVNELPPEVLKHIYAVTLDRYIGPDGSRGGTSGTSLAYLAWWLNDYAFRTGFPVQARALEGDEVSLGEGSFIDEKVKDGAVAVVECCFGYDHYVLVTGIEGDTVKLFDSWYCAWPPSEPMPIRVVGVVPVDDAPFSHNRLVERRVFEEPSGTAYSLNAKCGRDAVVFWRTDGSGVS